MRRPVDHVCSSIHRPSTDSNCCIDGSSSGSGTSLGLGAAANRLAVACSSAACASAHVSGWVLPWLGLSWGTILILGMGAWTSHVEAATSSLARSLVAASLCFAPCAEWQDMPRWDIQRITPHHSRPATSQQWREPHPVNLYARSGVPRHRECLSGRCLYHGTHSRRFID